MIRILKISPHLTARTVKQIESLLAYSSVHVTLFVKAKFLSLLTPLANQPQLDIIPYNFHRNMLRRLMFRKIFVTYSRTADIIHCHNEPNYHIVDAIRANKFNKPVIFDVHDLTSSRTGRINHREKYAYQFSDFILHVSPEFIQIGEDYFGKRPANFLYSSTSEQNIIEKPRQTLDTGEIHFAYQGGIYDPQWAGKLKYSYRNYLQIFREILEEGHHLHVFTQVPLSRLPSYAELTNTFSRFHFQGYSEYTTLLEKLSRCDIGIAGFNPANMTSAARQYLNGAIGNKLFDYLSAGLPVVVTNAVAMARFVSEYRCGAVKDDFHSWAETVSRIPATNIARVAKATSSEKQADKLLSIYANLLDRTID